jgi:hypothetical protein
MKTFAAILAFLSLAIIAHGAGSFPIKNGVLQNDLNAGGHAITNATDLTDTNGNSLLGGGGGPTNGITASQAASQIAATNNNILINLYDAAGTALAIGLANTNFTLSASNSVMNTASNWLSFSNSAYQAQFAPNLLSSETNNGQQSTNSFIRQEWFPAQQEGVSRTPLLAIGTFENAFNEQIWSTNGVQGISNAIYNATQSLYPFGYHTILLDDGWGNTNLDANGLMQVSPQMLSTFGSGTLGVSNLINAVHTNGFKIILYIDGGTNLSSAGFQHGMGGSLLWTNVSTLVRYGVDGIKSIQNQSDEERLAGILAQSSHPVYLMSSAYVSTNFSNFGPLYSTMCNSWFSSGGTDIGPYSNLIIISDVIASNELARYVKPGHFLETDFIGGEVGSSGPQSVKSHVILNALLSSPLFDGAGFYFTTTPYNQWFTNLDILSVHQDPAVICARRWATNNNCNVYLKPLGSPNGPTFALGVINRGAPAETVTLNFTNLYPLFASRVDKWSAYDCVSNVWVLTNSLGFTVNVETNDSILWKIYPGFPPSTNTGDGSGLTNLIHSSTVSAVSGISFAKTTNSDGSYNYAATVTASGSGNVSGPASSTDGNFAVYNGATGTVISNSAFSPASFDTNGAAKAYSTIVSNKVNGTNIFGTITNNTTGNATTATTATVLIGPTVSSSGGNGLTITDADGSAMGITGGGITMLWSPVSAVNPWDLRDTNNNTASIITLTGGFIGLGTGLTNAQGFHFATTNQLLDASALGANSHVKTGANTNLISSEDGRGLTNLVSLPASGRTNVVLELSDGTLTTIDLANLGGVGSGLTFETIVFGTPNFNITSSSTLFLAAPNITQTSVGNLPGSPVGSTTRTITEMDFAVADGTGGHMGGGTNFVYQLWTNGVLEAVVGTQQSPMIYTNFTGLSLTLPANGNWMISASNTSPSGSFTGVASILAKFQ